MSIRVGRLRYPYTRAPEAEGYTPIFVMVDNGKYPGPYNKLSPFHLKDSHGRFMENVWQFSRIFEKATLHIGARPVGNEATHYLLDDKTVTDHYWNWRQRGTCASRATRYCNGRANKGRVLHAYREHDAILTTDTLDEVKAKVDTEHPLSYVESRKAIYLPLYIELVKEQPLFKTLKELIQSGENLLILEVDGPHIESMPYYQKQYGVSDDFIVNDTMLATEENLNIMLNDHRHNFGHGYCLATALLEIDLLV